MNALLAQHPDFALADRALYWLGSRLAESGQDAAAAARFVELERRFPSSEWARRGEKSRADLLLAHGHFFAARALYHALVAADDPLARASGEEGLAESITWLWRLLACVVGALYLAGFALWNLRAAGPPQRWRRLPTELVYYLPVAAIFVAAALTENRLIGWATVGIAVGGALLTWVTSLGAAARLERGPMSLGARAGRALSVLIAALVVTFLAVQATGLTDLVIETFRSGPDR